MYFDRMFLNIQISAWEFRNLNSSNDIVDL